MSFRPLFLASTALVAVAGIALMSPAMAANGGADALPQFAQATPPTVTPPAGTPPAAAQDRPARPERAFSPRTACKEHVARRIGSRAYIKARLELKPEQMTAWSAFEKAADDVSAKENAKCTALPAELKTPPNFTDRLNMREDRMKTRLESIQAVKPAMLALYATLTPEQKVLFDRPMGDARGHRHGRSGRRGPGFGPR